MWREQFELSLPQSVSAVAVLVVFFLPMAVVAAKANVGRLLAWGLLPAMSLVGSSSSRRRRSLTREGRGNILIARRVAVVAVAAAAAAVAARRRYERADDDCLLASPVN